MAWLHAMARRERLLATLRKIKLVAMVRRPLAGSEAKEVMIRVYMLGMYVVRGPNAAPLVPHIDQRYDKSIF